VINGKAVLQPGFGRSTSTIFRQLHNARSETKFQQASEILPGSKKELDKLWRQILATRKANHKAVRVEEDSNQAVFAGVGRAAKRPGETRNAVKEAKSENRAVPAERNSQVIP
jgi:hypothetical protein